MADTDDSTPAAAPNYRVRLPANATTAPKSAENAAETSPDTHDSVASEDGKPKEIGGPKGPEPTRFGDWERDGRCVDF
jgi:hypothetical protein